MVLILQPNIMCKVKMIRICIMTKLLKISVAILALFYSVASLAVPVYYADRASFDAATSGLNFDDFESQTPGATMPDLIGDGYKMDANPGGHTADIFVTPAGFTSNITSNVVFANYFVDGLTVSFDTGINSFGADLFSLYDSSIFDILIYDTSNALIDSVVLDVANSATFWGLTSNVMIGSINFNSRTDQAEGMDDMSYGKVSEPTSLLLIGLGLLVLGFAKRKTT